jgi:hypothetical protein
MVEGRAAAGRNAGRHARTTVALCVLKFLPSDEAGSTLPSRMRDGSIDMENGRTGTSVYRGILVRQSYICTFHNHS